MLSLADFLDNAVTRGLALEASQCTVERFVLFNFDRTHSLFPPSAYRVGINILVI